MKGDEAHEKDRRLFMVSFASLLASKLLVLSLPAPQPGYEPDRQVSLGIRKDGEFIKREWEVGSDPSLPEISLIP
jgi:hypothetical protein